MYTVLFICMNRASPSRWRATLAAAPGNRAPGSRLITSITVITIMLIYFV